MRLHRYLLAEVLQPLLAVAGLLLVIFLGYNAAGYLADAAKGLISPHLVLTLVGLRTLVAFETLLPITLYFSIILGLGRLYSDSELTAMQAVGLSERQIAWQLTGLALPIALLVGVLAMGVRPWAYAHSQTLRTQALTEVDLNALEPNRFIGSRDGQQVFFAETIGANQRLTNPLIKNENGQAIQLIVAREAERLPQASPTPNVTLLFQDARLYQLDLQSHRDLVAEIDQLTLSLSTEVTGQVGQDRKAAATLSLMASSEPKDIAEWQWRVSRPLSSWVLALWAVPLARNRPRQGRYSRLLPALLGFVAYYQLSLFARNSLRSEWLPSWIGLFWSDALVFLLFILVIRRR